LAISNDILSSTLRILRDKAADQLHRTTPLLEQIESQGGVITVDGGSKVNHPVILAEHSNITQLTTGYEAVGLGVADPLRTAEFEWADFCAPIVITKKEELSNKGERAIIRIAEARLKSVMGMLKREFEKQAIAGTSTVLTDLESLNGLDAATGWFEEVTPFTGPQVNTVGGLVKSDFAASWQNQVASASDDFGANGTQAMSKLMIQAQTYAPEGSMNLILASPLSYEEYKNDLQQNERYMSATETQLDSGKLALAYNSALMYIEPNLGFTGSGASNKMSMYFLNTSLLHLYYDSDAKFQLDDFESVSGYASRAANIYVRCQLVASHLASQGILINAEA